jgi:hypothetical protein
VQYLQTTANNVSSQEFCKEAVVISMESKKRGKLLSTKVSVLWLRIDPGTSEYILEVLTLLS